MRFDHRAGSHQPAGKRCNRAARLQFGGLIRGKLTVTVLYEWLDITSYPVRQPAPVHSPISGRALRVTRQSEGPVSLGTALLDIGDPSDLEVIADLLTTDAVRVHPGNPVRIEGWGGDRPLDGEVRLVEPGAFTKVSALGVDEQRTNVVVDITSPPGARTSLGDAYRVDVRIIVAAQ